MKESSAEDNNRNRRVEDVFREGFEDAHVPPPARLWDTLDQALENQELKHYRKQAFWYRAVAAACLLFLLTAGAFLWQQDQGILGAGEGQLAKAPNTEAQEPSRNSASNQAATSTVPSRKAQEQPADFGSIPEKQAKNNSSGKANEEEKSGPVNGTRKELLLATSKSGSKTYNGGRSTYKATMSVASATDEQNKLKKIVNLPAANAINTISSAGSQTAIAGNSAGAIEDVALPAIASAVSLNSKASDSLLSSKMTTILYQGDNKKAQVAKVEVEPREASLPESMPSQKGWVMTLAYTPMYAYAPIAVGDAPDRQGMRLSEEQEQMYNQYNQALQEYRDSYSPAYSYTARVGAGLQLNDHWQIESGFLYGHHEAATTHSFLITKSRGMRINSLVPIVNKPEPVVKVAFEPELANNLEAVTPTEQYRTKYKYQQIGVPLRIAYHKSISKVFAFVSGGVNLHLLLNNRIESDNPEVQAKSYHYKDETSPFRAWQWAAATSAGFGYQVTHKMSVTVAPELTYSFSPALKESQSQADPYQVGVSIGGKYRLSK